MLKKPTKCKVSLNWKLVGWELEPVFHFPSFDLQNFGALGKYPPVKVYDSFDT